MQDELYGRWLDWEGVIAAGAQVDPGAETFRQYFNLVGVEELLTFMCSPAPIPAPSGSFARYR